MTDRLAALIRTKKLNREIIELYDNLGDECAKVGDDEGQAKWIRKGMDLMAYEDQLDEQIRLEQLERR